MFLSNNPLSGEKNSSNLSCLGSVFNLEGAMGPLVPFSSNGPLVKLELAILYLMWIGKYWAVYYFHLKFNRNDPLKNVLDWTLGFQASNSVLCLYKHVLLNMPYSFFPGSTVSNMACLQSGTALYPLPTWYIRYNRVLLMVPRKLIQQYASNTSHLYQGSHVLHRHI